MAERFAIVTKPFPGVEDGQVYPRTIQVGEVISGDLARDFIDEGRADEIDAATAALTAAAPAAPPAKSDETESGDVAPEAGIKIPADWKSMRWERLKKIADAVKGSEVNGATEARQVIEAELTRRAAAEKKA